MALAIAATVRCYVAAWPIPTVLRTVLSTGSRGCRIAITTMANTIHGSYFRGGTNGGTSAQEPEKPLANQAPMYPCVSARIDFPCNPGLIR